ncbi:Imidazolonepropionase [Candidatus Promineifilum breve]|uniref:Imidazolonepropionase n=1 Tax=Candidatus Promineifilum breve TaxID=1806508 RepID=A0A170PI07_9CHLR|nr:imidazolonepropionase [Candidatus Promineifilum breve]CUS04587.2 Imidazolonepropionase [Candidatus Promineifilum breve]
MTEHVDLLIHSAGQLCLVPPHDGPQRGAALGDLGLIADGALAVADGRVVAAGPSAALRARFRATQTIDAAGRCVLPGFVDPHTHLPWQGDRAAEFEQRLAGATYMEIMAAGGGIMSTVRQTRRATVAELVEANRPRLARMLRHGTTSAEAKTGYGLDTAAELKQLDAIMALGDSQPVELTPTFLPAHAVPEEYRGDTEGYVRYLLEDTLPAGAAWMRARGIVLFCDVFCEDGAFDLDQTRRILEAATALGYRLKVHADEFVGLGGTKLAVELGAVSADHLVRTPEADIIALGRGDTVAVGLPGTPFGLAHHDYTPAKAILAAGGALALATDLNPGTTWCESMPMVIALACRYMGLTQAQAVVAATLNAAWAIGRGHDVGSLTPGFQADAIILGVADYRQLGYRYGTNLVETVIKRGQVVV